MIAQEEISISTDGRGTVDLTRDIQKVVSESGINTGRAVAADLSS